MQLSIYSAYNSLNHRLNFGQFKLCTDIEKNTGPSVYVDATKTIHTPYCQGNVTVFGENAGQQCVAMSLCALIYSKITKVTFLLAKFFSDSDNPDCLDFRASRNKNPK